jgi:hypothetical protein
MLNHARSMATKGRRWLDLPGGARFRAEVRCCSIVCLLLVSLSTQINAGESGKPARIGVVYLGRQLEAPVVVGLRQGLRELGYVEERDVVRAVLQMLLAELSEWSSGLAIDASAIDGVTSAVDGVIC